MRARLKALPTSSRNRDLTVAHTAEESCQIVDMPGFYPDRKVGLDYIERFTPTLEQQLALAAARLAGLLNRVLR